LALAFTVLITVAAVWWVAWVTMLAPAEKSVASGWGQYVLALITILGPLYWWAWRMFRRKTGRPLDQVADKLAAHMREKWEKAAKERRLEDEPLPIRWRQAARTVAVPVTAAISTRDGRSRFDPLPGASVVSGSTLREGNRSTLYEVYGGLSSGRLVITGRAGSGKSAAAILLLLDALTFRKDDAGVPVPVMFTLHGWNPVTTKVEKWLEHKLAEIPCLRKDDASRLVRDRRIAVFLDGFDEMPEQLRPAAMRALSQQADFRLVLITRRDELRKAARHTPLLGAAVVELRPVKLADAVDHLRRHVTSSPPGWRAVAEELKDSPRGPLARALDRPLTITLLRDTYGQIGMVDELLDRERFPTPGRIEGHLLDQVVTAAYTPEPGDPKARYSAHTAERALRYIAHGLKQDGSRDLAWWAIPQWTDQAGALLARTMIVWFLTAIPTGLLLGLSYWIADGRAIGSGLPVGLAIGLLATFFTVRQKIKPKRVPDRWWLAPVTATGLLWALPLGLGLGFVLVSINDVTPRLVWWLLLGVVFWLTLGIGSSLFASNQDDNSSHDPGTSWRQDAVAGLAFAVMTGFAALAAGLCFGIRFDRGLPAALAIGLLGGLAAVLVVGPASTASWPMFCFQVELALRHRTPVRLMRFLEDARERGVLRTVGPVYQFRHAALQDRLAANVSKRQ
jgi:hypothetical protein